MEVGQLYKTSTLSTRYIFDEDFDKQEDGSLLNSASSVALCAAGCARASSLGQLNQIK